MNIPQVNVAKLSAVLMTIADDKPISDHDWPTTSYTYSRGGAKVRLAVKCPSEGCERLTRAVLVLDVDEVSKELAEMLGLIMPVDMMSFEFCDREGERLDVYAPRLLDIEDSATILKFLSLPLAA